MKIYLDLLPKNKKLEIKRKKQFLSALRQEFLFLLPLVFFIAILLNIWYLNYVQKAVLLGAKEVTRAQDKYKELSSYENKFKEVNNSSALLLKIKSGHLHWLKILEKMSDSTPDGIMITDLSTKNFRVYLLGKAKDRDLLLEFKNKLESNDCFDNVNLPLSNLVVKTDVDFQVDFLVKDDCIKQKS